VSIEDIFNDSKYNKIIGSLCKRKDHIDDLNQEVMLILLEMDKEKFNDMVENKKIWGWITSVIKNLYHSSSSPFYKKFRYVDYEFNDFEFSEPDEQDIIRFKSIDIIEEILDSRIDWYSAHLFRRYYLHTIDDDGNVLEPLSYRKLQELHNICGLNIHYISIRKTIIKTREKIIDILKNDYNIC
jgi:hypothetical protein